MHRPPTLNTLDPQQRRRLLRSHRKIEAVLGTVPYHPDDLHKPPLVSPVSSSSESSADSEDGSFVVVNRPGNSPYDFNTRSKAAELSRPALLRPHTAPGPAELSRKLLSPSLLTSVDAATPLSPTFAINFATKQATQVGSSLPLDDPRRKLAKLSRTLGENIPPELVFRPSSSGGPPPLSLRPRQRKPMPFSTPTPEPATAPNPAEPSPQILAESPLRSRTISRPRALSRTYSRQDSTTISLSTVPVTVVSPISPSLVVLSKPAAVSPLSPQPESPITGSTLAERRRKSRPRSLSLVAAMSKSTTTTIIDASVPDSPRGSPSNPRKLLSPTPSRETPSSSAAHLTLPPPGIRLDVSIERASYRFDSDANSPPTVVQLAKHQPTPASTTVDPRVLKALDVRPHAPRSPAPFDWGTRPLPPQEDQRKLRRKEHRSVQSESATPTKFLSSLTPSPPIHQRSASTTHRRSGGTAKRKEKEWSGEWNKQSMDEVVRALRGLKAR